MARPKGEFYAALGKRLRDARISTEASQVEIARAVGLSRPSIINIEKGRQPVDVHVLVRLAEVLGIPIAELLQSQQKPPKTRLLDPEAREWLLTLSNEE